MQSVERTAIREYVGTIAKVSGETFLLTYQTQKGSAKLVPPDPTRKIVVGTKAKVTGDWAGNLGAGALTTSTARKVEFL